MHAKIIEYVETCEIHFCHDLGTIIIWKKSYIDKNSKNKTNIKEHTNPLTIHRTTIAASLYARPIQ